MERKQRPGKIIILLAVTVLPLFIYSTCISTPKKKTDTDEKSAGETGKQDTSQKTGNTSTGDKTTGNITNRDTVTYKNSMDRTNRQYDSTGYKNNSSNTTSKTAVITAGDGIIYALFYGTIFAGVYIAILVSRIRKRKRR